ncbi:hypothetical protein [Hydrogenophaga sp.]|uniref:hypothetical protein n=1 Tax=Hydrogenophaga sp. TaxID=1904254 RepID=UPI00271815DD|nr:hypothetical protein [Hydrogenophaga sp.]MDO9136109.1 hypothetical protein [Hydrogenophaga sp.]
MKTRQIDVPLPDHGHAMPSVPTPLTREMLQTLEHALSRTLALLRRSLSVDAVDPGLIEYASWLPERRQ